MLYGPKGVDWGGHLPTLGFSWRGKYSALNVPKVSWITSLCRDRVQHLGRSPENRPASKLQGRGKASHLSQARQVLVSSLLAPKRAIEGTNLITSHYGRSLSDPGRKAIENPAALYGMKSTGTSPVI